METTLTPDETCRLVAVLKDIAGDTIVEHRRYKRRPVAMGLWVRFVTQGRARHPLCRVMLLNVSARGMCMLLQQPVHAGDRVLLRLPFEEGGGWLVLATVRNCQPTGQGTFRAGAEFVCWVDDPTGDVAVPREWVLSWN